MGLMDPLSLRACTHAAFPGLCGTCLVQVLQGKELLNKPDGVEEMVLKKWQAPTWRLGCRCVVGAINEPGFVKFKLQPQKPFIK